VCLHHLHDSDDPAGSSPTLLDALPSGSYFALTQPTGDFDEAAMAGMAATAEQSGIPYVPRSRTQVEALLDGLELVEPDWCRSRPGTRSISTTPAPPRSTGDPYSVYVGRGRAQA
jgi:hypothetical protein